MQICPGAYKATVFYRFKGQEERKFVSEKTPLDLKITEHFIPNFDGLQCPNFYEVVYSYSYYANGVYKALEDGLLHFTGQCSNYTTIQSAKVTVKGAIYGIGWETFVEGEKGFQIGRDSPAVRLYIYHQDSNGNDTKKSLLGASGGICSDPKSYLAQILSATRIDGLSDSCGIPKKFCRIDISFDDRVIFSDVGECPVTIKNFCDDCPDGTTRCACPGYPGFCCLPCEPTAAEIKSIADLVRGINNG